MLDEIPIGVLAGALFFLIVLSGFFSGSETGLISLNRYRLRHLAREGNRGAMRADRLLQRTDRLIGIILLGNNFVNILASALATVIGIRVLGEAGLFVATLGLTVVILIFAEVAPKTLAALHPERFAFPASFVLGPLLKAFYPLVWTINTIANGLLRLLRVSPETVPSQHLTTEELRTVVNEAGAMIPQRHQKMLLNLLDLEKSTVEAIMVPRHEIDGIDLEDDWDEVVEQLCNSQHTRLPVYRGSVDNVVGVVHMRNVLGLQRRDAFDPQSLEQILKDPYFIPEGTPLNTQLLNFQQNQRRIGMVVDEYGDIQGLATLDDILEEIVGEFTTDPAARIKEIHPQEDGSYLVDAGISVRELNRAMHWHLPIEGPKTLNGLILEYLEAIPESGTSLLLSGYPIEIVQVGSSAVKTVRIDPHVPRLRGRPDE